MIKNFSNQKDEFFIIEEKENTKRIKISTISHIVCKDYISSIIKTDNTQTCCCKSLNSIEKKLNDKNFYRVSRNTLVNLNHIELFKKKPYPKIIMKNKTEIKISRRRVSGFIKKYKFQ
jgi:DNA-binding LytR/AlgR family response regulator